MQTFLHIRTATYSDSAAVCDLLRDSILQSCTQDHRNDPSVLAAWLGNKNSATVGAWLVSPSNYAIVAEIDEKVAGVALLTNKGKIALLYVAPGAQSSGIGTRLLTALEDQASAWRLPAVQIASTASAQAFFLKRHFHAEGEGVSCFGIRTSLLEKRIPAKTNSGQRVPGKCKCSAGA